MSTLPLPCAHQPGQRQARPARDPRRRPVSQQGLRHPATLPPRLCARLCDRCEEGT